MTTPDTHHNSPVGVAAKLVGAIDHLADIAIHMTTTVGMKDAMERARFNQRLHERLVLEEPSNVDGWTFAARLDRVIADAIEAELAARERKEVTA